MKAVDIKCPVCGTVNKSLDLEETDGWMECTGCGNAVQVMKYVSTRNVPTYEEEYIDTDRLDDAISIIENIIENTDDRAVIDFGQKLLEMLKIAKECGTIVGFCF